MPFPYVRRAATALAVLALAALPVRSQTPLAPDGAPDAPALGGPASSASANTPPVPQGVADGDVFEVVRGQLVTVSFSFASPEPGQTTTITLDDPDLIVSRETLTPGNVATAELQFFGDVNTDDASITVTATDDGTPAASTAIVLNVEIVEPPDVACAPDAPLNLFGGYSPEAPETLGLFVSPPADIDMTGCTLVGFDELGEAISTYALTETLTAGQDHTYTNDLSIGGDNPIPLPDNSFADGAGAFAVVRGTAALGDFVLDVLADADFVFGGVYDASENEDFSNQTETDPAARRTAFADALLSRLGINAPPVPQGIADGDGVNVTVGGGPAQIDFSFLSPEAGQTTTITLTDLGDLDLGLDPLPGPGFTFSTTPGNPATATATFAVAPTAGSVVGDYPFEVEACDDAVDGDGDDVSECTVLQITVSVESAPAGGCSDLEFNAFDAGGDGLGERISIYNASAGSTDFTKCTVLTLDPITENVVVAETGAESIPPLTDYGLGNGSYTTGQSLPTNALPDVRGAFAIVSGTVAAGDNVVDLVQNATVHAAVVYTDGADDVFGQCADTGRGLGEEVPLCNTPEGMAAFAAALAQLGAAVSADDGPDAALDVAVWPNPAAASGTVAFGLAEAGVARVAVYDALGREVAVLADGPRGAGRHEVALRADGLPSGAYVVRVTAGDRVTTARLTVAR